MLSGNLFYYSANSYLSYHINRRFYKGKHYVWVSPVFNPAALDDMHEWRNIPASSSPHDIYINYRDAVGTQDDHSDIIERNKRGLKRGAIKLLAEGIINDAQFQFINHMIENAKINQFRPLLYIIPAHSMNNRIHSVPADELANPLSVEFRLLDLQDGEFEVLEFKK